MNDAHKLREYDLLLWTSGELDPDKSMELEKTFSEEDLEFLAILDQQQDLFERSRNLLVESTSVSQIDRSGGYRVGRFVSPVIALLALSLVLMLFSVRPQSVDSPNNYVAESVKPVDVKNKSLKIVKVQKEYPLKTRKSKYRKRYLSLKYRHCRLARLNLKPQSGDST